MFKNFVKMLAKKVYIQAEAVQTQIRLLLKKQSDYGRNYSVIMLLFLAFCKFQHFIENRMRKMFEVLEHFAYMPLFFSGETHIFY